MGDITYADYKHAINVWKDFKIKEVRLISWFICCKWYIITCRCI